MDPIELAGFVVGLLGAGFGIYQTFAARSAKKMYRTVCKNRCRHAADNAKRLADNLQQLCSVVTYRPFSHAAMEDPAARGAYTGLVGRVSALIEVAKDWIRFCGQLNEEHQDEFREMAVTTEEMEKLLQLKACLMDFEASTVRATSGLATEEGTGS